jgi:hypothetical protein
MASTNGATEVIVMNVRYSQYVVWKLMHTYIYCNMKSGISRGATAAYPSEVYGF